MCVGLPQHLRVGFSAGMCLRLSARGQPTKRQKQSRHWYAQTVLLDAARLASGKRTTPAASTASGTKTKNVVLSVGQLWCQGEAGTPYSSGARVPRPPHLRKGGEGGPPRLQKGAAGGVEIQPQRGPERCRIASKVMQSEIPGGPQPAQWQQKQQQQQRAAAARSVIGPAPGGH